MIDMSGWESIGAAMARVHLDAWGMRTEDARDPNYGRVCSACGVAVRAGERIAHECAYLPTLAELRAAREEGRRNREHYQREIRRMRALTPEEWSARVL